MHFLAIAFVYYLLGSVIAGSIMGAGFATNLKGQPNKKQLEVLQKIGTYIPLMTDGLNGALIAKANERRPTIVYIHGRSANRMELASVAEALFKEGYNAVLWDSNSRRISYGPKEIDQARRIITSIRTDPHVDEDRVYILGFSLGAAIAIGAASQDREGYIRGIVADSPYADLKNVASRYVTAFGIIPKPIAWPVLTATFASAKALHGIDFEDRNPVDWAEHVMACPVFLIHGKSDKRIPYTNSEQILKRLNTDKDLWLVDDAGHTKAFAKSPSEYIRRILAFLNRVDGANPD